MEIVFETIFPALGRLLGFAILELFGQVICYSTGYALVKITTLGRRPVECIAASSGEPQGATLILIGLLFWALVVAYGVLVLWQ
jgi:hypothetical protein